MKVHILYNIVNKPFGGANQFLKSLRDYLESIGKYEKEIKKADVILFNSHLIGANKGEVFSEVLAIKKKYPEKIIVHRIDGPISLYQNTSLLNLDYFIFRFNEILSDATIFQSEWSKKMNAKLGMKMPKYSTIIINAPDPKIFHKGEVKKHKKIRLIATSWSSNMNKGYETYKWLDNNLDFSKYDMTFVGNSPYKFSNIKIVKPLPSKKLSKLLREHDIFITASKKDPCSNSLIEALHSGLPAVVLKDGGHPQIVSKAGETFTNNKDLLKKIDLVAKNLDEYRNNIQLPNMEEVGKKYYEFLKSVKRNNEINKPKIIKSIFLLLQYKLIFQISALRGLLNARR